MSVDIRARHSLSSIFSDGHEPVWSPPVRLRHKTLPGWFPTSKAPQQKIRYRSPLMADGLMHIDTDPQVTRISPYPLSLVFGAMDESGDLKKREQTPDLAVLQKDGSVVFIDFVPYQIRQANSWYEDRELNLREFCRDVYDSAYTVLDERHIHAQPLFDNIKTLWAHRAVAQSNVPLARLRELLRSIQMPVTLGTLLREVKLGQQHQAFDEILRPQRDRSLTFSGVMQLVILGELEINLDRPFSETSVVRRVAGDGR